MSDLHAAINEFGKLVGNKNEASSNVFYRWQELRPLIEAALAAGVGVTRPAEPKPSRTLCAYGMHKTCCQACGKCQCWKHDHPYDPVMASEYTQ